MHKKEVDSNYFEEKTRIINDYKELPPIHIQRLLVKTSKKSDKSKNNGLYE